MIIYNSLGASCIVKFILLKEKNQDFFFYLGHVSYSSLPSLPYSFSFPIQPLLLQLEKELALFNERVNDG